MDQKKDLYESAVVWEKELQVGQQNLLQALKDFWPEGIASVLDVGCGDGKLSEVVKSSFNTELVGLDFSFEPLRHTTFPVVNGDASNLPFPDKSFDLVMTTDMLEHMPPALESQAWSELFRVGREYVLVAVPFQEELLDGMTCCPSCNEKFHVNWHDRSYEINRVVQNCPSDWCIDKIVLTGEAWTSMHPVETAFRRQVLGEWAGWSEAVCPECGHKGTENSSNSMLNPGVALALGTQIYTEYASLGWNRSHSEILVLFAKTSGGSLSTDNVVITDRSPLEVFPEKDVPDVNLVAYPSYARLVKSVDSGVIAQFPKYSIPQSLSLTWSETANNSEQVKVVVEDGDGLVGIYDLEAEVGCITNINFDRPLIPGYYGILVRFTTLSGISHISLGNTAMRFQSFSIANGLSGYVRKYVDGMPLYAQVTNGVFLHIESLGQPRKEFDKDTTLDKLLKNISKGIIRVEEKGLEMIAKIESVLSRVDEFQYENVEIELVRRTEYIVEQIAKNNNTILQYQSCLDDNSSINKSLKHDVQDLLKKTESINEYLFSSMKRVLTHIDETESLSAAINTLNSNLLVVESSRNDAHERLLASVEKVAVLSGQVTHLERQLVEVKEQFKEALETISIQKKKIIYLEFGYISKLKRFVRGLFSGQKKND